MYINILLEKYLDTVVYDSILGPLDQTEVFISPSSKERVYIFNDDDNYTDAMRFIVDSKSKKVYGFIASTLHDDVWKKVGDRRQLYTVDSLLVGVLFKNKTITFESSYLYDKESWQNIIDSDWSWADKYIPNLSKSLLKEKTVG